MVPVIESLESGQFRFIAQMYRVKPIMADANIRSDDDPDIARDNQLVDHPALSR